MFSSCAHRNAARMSAGRKLLPVSTHPYLFISPLKKLALFVPFSQMISALSVNLSSFINKAKIDYYDPKKTVELLDLIDKLEFRLPLSLLVDN